MKTMLNVTSGCAALFACVALYAPSVLGGIDYVWAGASGGSWSDTDNWRKVDGSFCTAAPKMGDSVTFMPGDGVSLNVIGNANVSIMSVSNGNVTVTSSSSSSYHNLKKETPNAGGRDPRVYVAEGAALSLLGARMSSTGGETLTKAGGGTLSAVQVGLNDTKPYGAVIVDGGTFESSGVVYASNVVIKAESYLCSRSAGIYSFSCTTNITVEGRGRLLMTGGADYSNAKKQNSVVPVRGEGELCIDGWIKMEASQLADFTGVITGSGGLVTESGTVLHNISMSGGELGVDGYTEILGGDSSFGNDCVSFNTANATLAVKGGFIHGDSVSNEYVSTILPDYGGIRVNGSNADSATFRVEGGRVHISAQRYTPGRLELAGGIAEFIASPLQYAYLPMSSFTAENPAVVLFDGGEAVFSPINAYRSNFYPFGNQYYEALSLQVGAGGAVFDERDAIRGTSTVHLQNPLVTADGTVSDGGLTHRGVSTMCFYKPLEINGPVKLLGGINRIVSPAELATTPEFFGTGSFILENAVLSWSSSFTEASSLSLAEDSSFTYGGVARLDAATTSDAPAKTVTAGALVRKGKGSVLQIMDRAGGLSGDGASRITFDGGLSTNAAGLVTHPVFIHQVTGFPRYVAFATYDETVGLRAKEDWLDASTATPITDETADRIVRVGEDNANYTLRTAGGACAALFLRNKEFNIRAEYTGLTVGDGVNPALIAIGQGKAKGSGTVDFRTSEGIIYIAESGKDIPWSFAGSSGVTFASRADTSVIETSVSGTSIYSGGTWITGGDFTPTHAGAFSSGKITVAGGKYVGGSVSFKYPLAMANDFSISGYGKGSQYRGAFSFESGATLTGSVEIDGMARIGVPSNVVARIDGPVSGGFLEICGSTGILALASCNTYTGGTHVAGGVTLRIAQAESAGTGCVTLDNGILSVSGSDKDSPIVFTNRISGIGRVVVEGKSPVRFTDGSMAYIGAETVYPGTSVSFPALSDSDIVITKAPPEKGLLLIFR